MNSFVFLHKKEAWLGYFIILISLVVSIAFLPEPRYGPIQGPTIIDGNTTWNQDKILKKGENVQIVKNGYLKILNSKITFRASNPNSYSILKVGEHESGNQEGLGEDIGRLLIQSAEITTFEKLRLNSLIDSNNEIYDSKLVNVLINQSRYNYFMNNVSMYWLVDFKVVDSNNNPINNPFVKVNQTLQNPYNQPFEIFSKRINNVYNAFVPSTVVYNISAGKQGYLQKNYTEIKIDTNLLPEFITNPQGQVDPLYFGIYDPFNFTIVLNYMPVLTNNIPNQTITQGTLQNTFNLNDYFEDLDHNLEFSFENPQENLTINISETGLVSFNSSQDYSGTTTIKFFANESNGNLSVESNDVIINITSLSTTQVNLISPLDNHIENTLNNIDFTYNVVEGQNPTDSCFLTSNNIVLDYQQAGTQFNNIFLPNGIYNWNITCNDTTSQEFYSETRNLEINTPQTILINLSDDLQNNILWDISNLPILDQPANGNNNDQVTSYNFSVLTTDFVDVYIRATGDLTSSQSDIIPLQNEKYSFSLIDNTVSTPNKYPLTTNFTDNLIVENTQGNFVVFLKFFLTASSGQPHGDYSNNIEISVVPTGGSP